MKPEFSHVRNILINTISLLCKNSLTYQQGLRIHGLLGITLDEEVFLVEISEHFGKNDSASCAVVTATGVQTEDDFDGVAQNGSENTSKTKRRKRRSDATSDDSVEAISEPVVKSTSPRSRDGDRTPSAPSEPNIDVILIKEESMEADVLQTFLLDDTRVSKPAVDAVVDQHLPEQRDDFSNTMSFTKAVSELKTEEDSVEVLADNSNDAACIEDSYANSFGGYGWLQAPDNEHRPAASSTSLAKVAEKGNRAQKHEISRKLRTRKSKSIVNTTSGSNEQNTVLTRTKAKKQASPVKSFKRKHKVGYRHLSHLLQDSTVFAGEKRTYAVGEKVQALRTGKNIYPATVTSVHADAVTVTFVDGFKRRCKDFHVKPVIEDAAHLPNTVRTKKVRYDKKELSQSLEIIAAPKEKSSCENGKKDSKNHRKRRPCLFCGKFQTNLRRHILHRHSKEEEVIEACKLPKQTQDDCFDRMRKAGILKYNREQLQKGKPMYECERTLKRGADVRSTKEIIVCSYCNGMYARRFFGRHQKRCVAESACLTEPLPMDLLVGSNLTTARVCQSVTCNDSSDVNKGTVKHVEAIGSESTN